MLALSHYDLSSITLFHYYKDRPNQLVALFETIGKGKIGSTIDFFALLWSDNDCNFYGISEWK